MTPYDLILWGCAVLVAAIPTSIGLMILGVTMDVLHREWRKRR